MEGEEVLLVIAVSFLAGFLFFAACIEFNIADGVFEFGDGRRFVRVVAEPVEDVSCEDELFILKNTQVDCEYYVNRVAELNDQWNNLEDKRTECAEDYLVEGLCKFLKGQGYECYEVDE